MASTIPSLLYAAREKGLSQIDSRLETQPDSLDLLIAKAHFLTELGRPEEAKAIYLKAVTLAPTSLDVLHNFGKLLYDNRYMSAARTIYTQAIACHPDNPISYTCLANVFYQCQELEDRKSVV